MISLSSARQPRAIDLSARTKLRITGADRLRYLNGQISNDLRKASESVAIHACVLTAKGKINAEVFIVAKGDSFLLDSEAEVRESLAARLERYIIADDVQIEDVTDEFGLFHLLGDKLMAAGVQGLAVQTERYGEPGWDLWVKPEEGAEHAAALARSVPFLDEGMLEAMRIERGIPRWGRELTEEIIPTEANLEATAIDYAKGCYIGQEVISRIKMSGQTNKRLCGLTAAGEAVLSPGMRLLLPREQKDVGWITSAGRNEGRGRAIALGFLKRGFQEPGSELCARSADDGALEVSVRVAALPFS